MATQQELLRLVHPGNELRRPPLVGLDFLHQRPVRTADLVRPGLRLSPQDLIRFIRAHWPISRRTSPPRLSISLTVLTPAGRPAVQISFK